MLFGIDLTLPAGGVATLLGRNGMGKTTTVRSILGLTPPRSGTVRFLGERIDGLRPDRIDPVQFRGEEQRRLPPLALERVDVGPVVEQGSDRLGASRCGRQV